MWSWCCSTTWVSPSRPPLAAWLKRRPWKNWRRAACRTTSFMWRRCARQPARRSLPGATITRWALATWPTRRRGFRVTTRCGPRTPCPCPKCCVRTATARPPSANGTTRRSGKSLPPAPSITGRPAWASSTSSAFTVAPTTSGSRACIATPRRSSPEPRRRRATTSPPTWPTTPAAGCARWMRCIPTSPSSCGLRRAARTGRTTCPRSGSSATRANSTRAGTACANRSSPARRPRA